MRLQILLPRSLIPEVLSALHDAPGDGHLDVTKTLERVQKQFYWYGKHHDVEDWCRRCEKCSSRKSPQQPGRAPQVSSCPGYQFETIALGIMGPLPTTKSVNKYILVAGNYFSKWKKRSPFHAKKRTPEPRNWSMRSFPGTGHLGISTQTRDGTFEAQLLREMCHLFNMD